MQPQYPKELYTHHAYVIYKTSFKISTSMLLHLLYMWPWRMSLRLEDTVFCQTLLESGRHCVPLSPTPLSAARCAASTKLHRCLPNTHVISQSKTGTKPLNQGFNELPRHALSCACFTGTSISMSLSQVGVLISCINQPQNMGVSGETMEERIIVYRGMSTWVLWYMSQQREYWWSSQLAAQYPVFWRFV